MSESRRTSTEAVICDLRALAAEMTPRSDFADQLESRLLNRWQSQAASAPASAPALAARTMPRSSERPLVMRQFALALVAVVAITVLATAFSLLRSPQPRLPLLPRLVSAAGPADAAGVGPADTAGVGPADTAGGLPAGADFILVSDLPRAPTRVPVYQVTSAAPQTVAGCLAWARDFGLPDPRMLDTPDEPQAIVVADQAGNTLTFSSSRWAVPGVVYAIASPDARAGDAPSAEQAQSAAITFLRDHGVLTEAYRIEDAGLTALQPGAMVRTIYIVPELDGRPILGEQARIRVEVDADLAVRYATVPLLTFESASRYPIKSASTAWSELLAGGGFRIETAQAVAGGTSRTVTVLSEPGTPTSPPQEEVSDGGETWNVSSVELAIFYEANPATSAGATASMAQAATLSGDVIAQPVWVFRGIGEDATHHITAYVQAVQDAYLISAPVPP